MGWVAYNVPPTDPNFGKVKPCDCSREEIAGRKMRRLDSMDGLTDEERGYTLDTVFVEDQATQQALDAIRGALLEGSGFVTLAGDYGRGKTRLLISAINEAKRMGQPAIYTTMEQLLTYLRQAFSPSEEVNYLDRWELLSTAPVLAIDELDKMNTTEWAMTQFTALVDRRWRDMRTNVTFFALNRSISTLPGDIADRLEDGRGTVITMSGASRRPNLR